MAGEDTSVSGVAGRYATALFELAREQNALEAVRADLDRFDALVADSADLTRLVRSPLYTAEEQAQSLQTVLDRAGIGGLAANFLKLIAQKRRLFAVRDIVRAFRTLVSRHRGEMRAKVTVAEPLSEGRLRDVREALQSVTGKDVDLDVKVDPAIIGGLVVQLGSRMIDTSLRSKLTAIKSAMKEAR